MAGRSGPIPGAPVEIAAFGRMVVWEGTDPETLAWNHLPGPPWVARATPGNPAHVGVTWEEPRRVRKVAVRFDGPPLPREAVRLEYRRHTWPPPDRGGWTSIDDPFHGTWVAPRARLTVRGNEATWTLLPLAARELAGTKAPVAEDLGHPYRLTYGVRLLVPEGTRIASLEVASPHRWRAAAFLLEFAGETPRQVPEEVVLEVHNGYLGAGGPRRRTVALPPGESAVEAAVLYAGCEPDSAERTLVTARRGEAAFSFVPQEVLAAPLWCPDLGVYVRRRGGPSLERYLGRQRGRSVYDMIADEPEQTWTRASSEIPQLIPSRQRPLPLYVPLGAPENRQEFCLSWDGSFFIDKSCLKSPGPDAERLLFEGERLRLLIATGATPDLRMRDGAVVHRLLEDCLPVVISSWVTEGVEYRMTSFATLEGEVPGPAHPPGTRPSLLLGRLTARNPGREPATAVVRFALDPPERLAVEEGAVWSTGPAHGSGAYPERRLRLLLRGAPAQVETHPGLPGRKAGCNAVRLDLPLAPGEERSLELAMPFVTYTDRAAARRLGAVEFDRRLEETAAAWRDILSRACRFEAPERILCDFYKANICHVEITADPDPATGLKMLPAGTLAYRVCLNEAVHQIRALDLRGMHEEAAGYLEPITRLQGTRGMHGRFRSQEGVLHGLRVAEGVDYQAFDYNLDHGFALWMLCEHYRFTGDRSWLRAHAGAIVAACEWIARERRATMTEEDGERVPEWGLLPAGHLEDNPEWHYWYAVNAYAARGMLAAGQVLHDIDHPSAAAIAREAAAYLEDIRSSLRRASALSPLVRLRDGTSIPHFPTRARLRGRDLGWIRDALYGPVHLIDCGVFPYDSREATWILKDAEDNVFISAERGRRLEDFDRQWFSWGGMTIQSNLVPYTICYVMREQPKHALRPFYNSLAANLYPELRQFTEHPVAAYGLGAGPFYKTPDESCFVTWLRYLLLAERGNELLLAPATPSPWLAGGGRVVFERAPTYFGPVSLELERKGNAVFASVEARWRKPPGRVTLRIRIPEATPLRVVEVNGSEWNRFEPETGRVFLEPEERLRVRVGL